MIEGLNQGFLILISTLAIFDMPKYAKNLGITNVKEFLYQIPQMELHNGLCSLTKDGDVRALRDWLEFALEKLIHIYVKHVEQAFEEQVDRIGDAQRKVCLPV